MELIARFLCSLTVYAGWLASPIYTVMSFRPTKKHLPKFKQPDILNLSAVELARKIRKKELTSEQVVKAFIERCRDVNDIVNAIVEDRFLEAVEDAKKVDQLISSGKKTEEELQTETPLLGVPITVKEACKLSGMSHCVGTIPRQGIKADNDGEAVANLKKAGAIPIAVTNTPELCASIETHNSITGYTPNPYDLTRTSGGSSGGEAALIASGASALGIGSDLAGSIRVPALFTGIFGHKPTPGIVSNEGHYPNIPDKEFQKLLNIGPMSRYAADLKLSLKIMAGEKAPQLNLDEKVNLGNLRIYYGLDNGSPLSEVSVDSNIKKSIVKSLEHFESTHGCEIFKFNLQEEFSDLLEICVMQSGDIENISDIFYLKGPENESNTYLEAVKALLHLSDYCLQTVAMRFIIESLLFIPLYKRFKYEAKRNDLAKKLKETLGDDGVLIFPSFATLAFHKYELLWKVSSLSYPMFVNVLGLPATQVPTGLSRKGLPVGFQIVAAPKQDRLCLAVAEELEKVFGGWVEPPSI